MIGYKQIWRKLWRQWERSCGFSKCSKIHKIPMLILKFGLNREFKEQTERSVSHIALRIVKRDRSCHCTSTIFLSLRGHHQKYKTWIRSTKKKRFYARPRLLNKGVKMGNYSFTESYPNNRYDNRKLFEQRVFVGQFVSIFYWNPWKNVWSKPAWWEKNL